MEGRATWALACARACVVPRPQKRVVRTCGRSRAPERKTVIEQRPTRAAVCVCARATRSVGHKGKFGHEYLEFEFRPDGRLRYANNSNYRKDNIIRKEGTRNEARTRTGRKRRARLSADPMLSPSASAPCVGKREECGRGRSRIPHATALVLMTSCTTVPRRSDREPVRAEGAQADHRRQRDCQVRTFLLARARPACCFRSH